MSTFESSTAAVGIFHDGISEELAAQVEDARSLLLSKFGNGSGEKFALPLLIAAVLPLPETNALAWLAAQTRYPKLYWEDRTGEIEVAGFGIAASVQETDASRLSARMEELLAIIAEHPQGHLLRFIGGSKFDPQEPTSVEWRDFPALMYIQPEVAIVREGTHQQLIVTVPFDVEDSTAKIVRRIERELAKLKSAVTFGQPFPVVEETVDTPERLAWEEMCDQAIGRLRPESLAKVVLARKRTSKLSAVANPFQAIERLREDNPGCFSFVCAHSGVSSFSAVTPERLFRLAGNQLEADALGGTAKRFSDEAASTSAGKELFESSKISIEHRLVVDDIQQKLQPLCSVCSVDVNPQLVRYSHVQHLLTRFVGQKKHTVSAADILFALAPTSAVSGNPSDRAQVLISELEPFQRGWYAGAVGMISLDHVEFAVALRCMLVQDRQVSFYAGAGIVPQSQSAEEWDEIEYKTASTSRLFRAAE